MITLFRIIIKIVLFPVALIAKVLSIAINIAAHISTLVAGPFCLFLIAMAVVSGVRHEWLNVCILSGTFIAVQLVYIAAAFLTSFCSGLYAHWGRI